MEQRRRNVLQDLMSGLMRYTSAVMPFQRRTARGDDPFDSPIHTYLRRQGYSVQNQVVRKPDGSVDLIATRGGKRYVVKCKRWTAEGVSVPVIAG